MRIIIAIRDRKTEAYGNPIFFMAKGEAIRSFQDAINDKDPNNQMARHPGDFDAYIIGTYNEQTGTIEARQIPELLIEGNSLAQRTE